MKKMMCGIAIFLTCLMASTVSAKAYDASSAGVVSTAGVATVIGIENAYEASVIARMSGRAGAATAGGAKGISFEIIYSDIKNVFGNLKNGYKTKLSASSIDSLADLVTVNKKGEVVQLVQCKDGTSVTQIGKVIEQASSGKYASAEIVGTKEFSYLYNKQAAAKGVAQRATDSGISTKTTTRVANKALGITPTGSQIFKSVAKNSAAAALVAGCISLAESVYRGDDVYIATGNVVEDAGISAVSIALATVSSAELPAILTAMGASAAVANAAASVVAIAVPVAGGYALYLLAEESQLAEKVASATEDVLSSISVACSKVAIEMKAGTKDFASFAGVNLGQSIELTVNGFYAAVVDRMNN